MQNADRPRPVTSRVVAWAKGPACYARLALPARIIAVPALCHTGAPRHARPRNRVEQRMTVNEQDKSAAVEQTARRLGRDDQVSQQVLGSLWDEAFEQGRLAALDEFQDRFCVCMK